MARDLADQNDHRRRILKGGMDADRGVAGTGPACHQQHSGSTRELAVSLGHEGGATFLAAGYETDLRGVEQSIEDLEIALPGYAKRHIDPMGAQCGDNELAAAEKVCRHRPALSLLQDTHLRRCVALTEEPCRGRDTLSPDAI